MGRIFTLRLCVYLMASAIALTGLIFMFAPRPAADLDVHFVPPDGVADLERYLAGREASVDGLRPELAKEIIWADPASRAQTPYSIIYLHGFSASKGEIRPVADRVAQALGANLFYTRLTGHGASPQAMGEARVSDWMTDVAEALWIGHRLGRRTIVIATSTGGTLITPFLLKPEWSGDIAAVVLVSPNFGLKATGSSLLTAPFAASIARLVIGRERRLEPLSPALERYWTTRYPVTALLPMAALVKAVTRLDFGGIGTPTFFYYSQQDQVVDPETTDAVYAAWGGRKATATPAAAEDPSNHVIAGDALSPAGTGPAVEAITTWLRTTLRM